MAGALGSRLPTLQGSPKPPPIQGKLRTPVHTRQWSCHDTLAFDKRARDDL